MDENKTFETSEIDFIRLLGDLVRPIVDNPDAVNVTAEETESGLVLTLKVAEDDVGMIIGKHGKIARALRTVVKAAAKISGKKVSVEIR
jgi:predicted RNA-binding protein YlqC (UPF0109 family)